MKSHMGNIKLRKFLDRWFDGSAKRLVSALGEKLTKEDGEELRGILDDFDFDDNHNKNILAEYSYVHCLERSYIFFGRL